MPADTGLTVPAITVALVLLLLHEPPVLISFNTKVEPIHTIFSPVIVPATGIVFTDSILVTMQPVGKIYDIVGVPVSNPFT